MRSRALLFALALGLAATGIAQRPQNPFAAPAAKFQYAPDRVCDLLHLAVTIDVDYPARKVVGRSVNTMAALRDGVSEIVLHAGKNLKIEGVKVDGADAKFERKEDELHIAVHPLVRGEKVQIEVAYNFGKGESDGWNWVEPKGKVANREGFFTQGETNSNSEWAPTWDYPNDFTTSETTTTVPAGWDVIGNGVLVSDEQSKDGKRRTFHWKLDMPHATYLLSLCGGPFDIKRDNWKGVPLLYVVPKGMGNLIDYSFGNTKDMLSFFSDKLGVKYPWPKYAQDAMFDFGGGMENVSATTLGEGSLTDPRAGEHQMDWVNSHELGHQWFGDFVTCKDWGHIWLNESFATFMEMIYIEHARGKNAFEQDVESDMQQYFDEAKHYKRPLVTNFYADPGAMFDRHTYPKGGVILHTLRNQLGDKVFFQGLHDYLTKHAHEPVESQQLCRSMTESSGIDLEPFWNQWIYKPGHPVIDWSWSWDEAKKEVVVHVKQTQDT
ncbi:MAG: M1 family metallopeptidase, partial [Fimbriimonas ginsengisoli]|nr:M1 family metallopeptidase [Fimbriimonas ginsengisoli]